MNIFNRSITIVKCLTKIREDPIYQHSLSSISILYEEIPNVIELSSEQIDIEHIWLTIIIQENSSDIVKIFETLLNNQNELFRLHTNEWQQFWAKKQISIEGNKDLSNALDASMYALVSALPSLNTSWPRTTYFGLSPSGLGLDRKLEVYNGHNFWDDPIFMHPSILLLEPSWSKELLNYRYYMRETAHDNAINTSYMGYR